MKRYTNEDNNKDKQRFKMLLEYSFGPVDEEDDEEINLGDDLITEEPPEEGDALDLDGIEATDGDEPMDDEPMDDEPMDDEPMDGEPMDGEPMGDEPLPEPEPMEDEPLPEPEPMEDEVELDVTELVQGTEEAKNSADQANEKVSSLLDKFESLTASLDKMEAITAKIDSLENEIEKRNPTPEEKLEMRSLNSYPYNLKLTDYWSEKEGNYDAMNDNQKDEKTKEYVLTQDEVDQDYNPMEIKDSFDDSENYKNSNIF